MAKAVEQNNEAKKMLIQRERFKSSKDNKEYWGYFFAGILRGREIKVQLVPPDNGGFSVLDLVFGDGKTAELVKKPYRLTDEKTGEISEGFTYEAQNTDETTGVVYSGQIKPSKKSDKDLLHMFLQLNAL